MEDLTPPHAHKQNRSLAEMSEPKRHSWVNKRPFVFLIVVQIVLLILDAVLDRNGSNTILAALVMSLFIWAVVAALSSVHIPVHHLKTLGGFAVVMRIMEYYVHHPAISVILYLAWGTFSLLVIAALLKFTLRADHSTTFSKLAAVSAAYIAFPQFWNSIFLLIQAADPAAFQTGPNQSQPLAYQDMLYFSYNVFTTVDVGNTVPVSHIASIAVILAEIVAQLFVVIFIARLVGLFPGRAAQKEEKKLPSATPLK